MGSLNGTPKLLRGALAAIQLPDPTPKFILFQFNPTKLQRSLAAKATGGEGAPGEALRLTGPPEEKIKVDVELDAVDQLEVGSETAATSGIHPQLALLELLLYPSTATVIANTALLAVGTIEVVPMEAPLVLFIWGKNRIVPVRITAFTISEEEYDNNLNPIRANISLELLVLSYDDLSRTNPGHYVFMAHHMNKEVLSRVGQAQGVASVLGGDVPLL
jgi:hypothetical protein